MTLIQFAINTGFVLSLMFLGLWLESINGIRGVIDRFLTPVPMGAGGLFIVFIELELT